MSDRNGHGRTAPGLTTAWRGTWGPMTDGRSKLRRLARRIEGELRAGYVVEMPLEDRVVALAARYMALAEQAMAGVGSDPKCTRRAVTALQAAADRQVARLEPRRKVATLAERLGRA